MRLGLWINNHFTQKSWNFSNRRDGVLCADWFALLYLWWSKFEFRRQPLENFKTTLKEARVDAKIIYGPKSFLLSFNQSLFVFMPGGRLQ